MSGSVRDRKRNRRELEDETSSSRKSETNQGDGYGGTRPVGPLHGVVACLSGLAQDRKKELHQLIVSLGGKYTRELNLDKNTHLITELAEGAKYNLAASSAPKMIHIITPSWLVETAQNGERAKETDHVLKATGDDLLGQGSSEPSAKGTLLAQINKLLSETFIPSAKLVHPFLFDQIHFYLIGFDDNLELKQKLSRLIRRGNGIIHWEMSADISILLLSHTCDDHLVNAANVVTAHHANYPPAISPHWVVDSYQMGQLMSTSDYPPIREDRTKPSKQEAVVATASTTASSSTTMNVSIFRGCLFCFVYSPVVPSVNRTKPNHSESPLIEFDRKEQEGLVQNHGGQILSNKLLGALKMDSRKTGGEKRRCHVVCWGSNPPRLDTNPLVSQLQRYKLCDLVLVTPIWVKACVSLRKRILPERLPSLLIPQAWSMRSSVETRERGNQSTTGAEIAKSMDALPPRNRRLDISLTGFQGTEKAVMVHVIRAIGGVYHGNMSSANTHLVYKKNATGLKLEKAKEWGLHIVSVQWLYHILQHGYGGVYNEDDGCEKRFTSDHS